MGRIARSQILYEGCFAHVFTRSLEKRRVFVDEDDFNLFHQMLLKMKAEHSFRIFHYCLMHTHFHLAVGIGPVEEFSRAMQAIKWEYTKQYNRKYNHFGPLWRERFKSLLIENEAYLYVCEKGEGDSPQKGTALSLNQ